VTEPRTPLALQLQDLSTGTDRVLAVAALVAQRNEEATFSPAEINAAFDAFRLPAPSNTSQSLAQLRSRGFAVKRRAGGWSLTPRGEAEVTGLLGDLPEPDRADSRLTRKTEGGAELGEGRHTVIPPFFAPAKWAHGINRFLQRYPFDENAFCMTRFPADPLDPIGDVVSAARTALDSHGLRLHLASDASIEDDLWSNVAGYLWACRYGLALFEDRAGRGLSYNLVIEVGAMLATGRRCALLKDRTQGELPSDLVGQIYRPVDFDDLDQVGAAVHEWAANDLGFGRCKNCP
jgi:hypothetical protein